VATISSCGAENVRLLLTRPEPDAQRTATALRAKGHEAVIAPLLRIEAQIDVKIGTGPWAAVLVTSANAGPAIAFHERAVELRTLPVFAVGKRSALTMTAAGFGNVRHSDGDVNDLAAFVAGELRPGTPLLYLAGEERSGDLAGELRNRGFTIETVVVYSAVATANLPQAAAEALTSGIGVLHFSRRSAEAYLAAARAMDLFAAALRPVHYCLSTRVAEPLKQAGAADVRIAAAPTEAHLIALIDMA
jgi:uroporphyrinogen-III synthase